MNTVLHPNPQFARQDWLDLCGLWSFAFDDEDEGLDHDWATRADPFDRTIRVPYPPESEASQINAPDYHPVVWYRRHFTARRAPSQRVLLRFGAVDYSAQVWVNGQYIGQHQGGHTPFSFDITHALSADQPEQSLVVRAEDRPDDLGQPRGKQDWQAEPHAIWYRRTTGIWQPVWLEMVSHVYMEKLRWTPRLDTASLGLTLCLNRQPARPLSVTVRLRLRDKALVEDTYQINTRELAREIALPVDARAIMRDDYLWSPERPNLIEAEITLREDGASLDRVESYAGMRSVATQNRQLLLNGRPYYLRMVLEQGYWPESCLAAPSEDALRREVELIKQLGFNGVRIHQKVEDPRFLYWCDRLGLAVWGEMANAYVFSPEAAARLTCEWLQVLERDYNHPCIVTWVPVNESWGTPQLEQDSRQQEFLRALYALTKTFDPTRPVIDNDGWEHVQTDILSIHDYAYTGTTLKERYQTVEAINAMITNGRTSGYRVSLDHKHGLNGTPVMLTEFGGISYAPRPGEPWFGYGTVRTGEEYLSKLHELVSSVVACPTFSGFCYTQLTDTEQEKNGLLLANREPKFDPDQLRRIIQWQPV